MSNTLKQLVIHTFKDELNEARSELQEYDDFWEWYAENYPETKEDLFGKFMVEYSKKCETDNKK
tara:strand:- start:1552 stop:1743 length:192 start_codon:yes stop_codon:yes gene_type:complete